MYIIQKCLLLSLLSFSLLAEKVDHRIFRKHPRHPEVETPWLTGPLFAPSGITIQPGHVNIEPYLFFTARTGYYDHHWKARERKTFWVDSFEPSIQVGVTPWMDFTINPSAAYQTTRGVSDWVIGDLPIILDFQLYRYVSYITEWSTGLKLYVKEKFPIGKYQKLNPKKWGTDCGGDGAWKTSIGLAWGNLFYLGRNQFFNWRLSLDYTFPAKTHVKKWNAYGGGKDTDGNVYPGFLIHFDSGFELTLTRNWVLALDILGTWQGKTHFKGKTKVPNAPPASFVCSIAPAIEYNWNANLGIIFGPWISLAGRNANQFISGVFALNYYY